MKISGVTLNKDQAGWFARNVAKMKELLEKSEKRNEGVTERATYKLISAMEAEAKRVSELLADEAVDQVMIHLTKKQKMVLREMVNRMASGLEVVNEEYRKRGGHEEYIEKNEHKAKYLKAMSRKLK